MSEKPQEEIEYNIKNLYNIAIGKNLIEQVGEKTKTATAGIISGGAVIPMLTTATGIIGGFGLGGLAATGLGFLAEKNLQKDSGQSFGAGLGMGGKIATSIGLASLVSSGVFSFLFTAFGTLGALNILYFYLIHGKEKTKEIIEEQNIEEENKEEKPAKIVDKIEEVVDNLEESLDILFDGKEQKMSLKYVKNRV